MSLRITTGLYGGRILHTPVTHKMRPTRDIVRQAAFNMLLSYIDFEDIVALDLCEKKLELCICVNQKDVSYNVTKNVSN